MEPPLVRSPPVYAELLRRVKAGLRGVYYLSLIIRGVLSFIQKFDPWPLLRFLFDRFRPELGLFVA